MQINRAIGLGIAIVVLKLLLFSVVSEGESFLVASFKTGEVMMEKIQAAASSTLAPFPK